MPRLTNPSKACPSNMGVTFFKERCKWWLSFWLSTKTKNGGVPSKKDIPHVLPIFSRLGGLLRPKPEEWLQALHLAAEADESKPRNAALGALGAAGRWRGALMLLARGSATARQIDPAIPTSLLGQSFLY